MDEKLYIPMGKNESDFPDLRKQLAIHCQSVQELLLFL